MPNEPEEPPLSRLRHDATPPAELKGRVTRTLQSRGLIRHPVQRSWGWAVAAGIGLFALGLAVGRWRMSEVVPGTGQRYALLLYDPASFDRTVPEPTLVAEYRDWAISLGDRLSVGEKLGADERMLRQGDSERRPASAEGAAGPLGGLFIVQADSWEEAMAIARTCPHLKHGGVIAVREIEET
jgi:hypothetical protein